MIKDERGQAFVEAAILFPIMIMIFAALVLLSIYLPTRGALQRATQYAATVISNEVSDTWLFFDEGSMSFYWESNKDNLQNVYAALFSGIGDIEARAKQIVIDIESRNLSSKAGQLSVESGVVDQLFYKEIVVKARREFTILIDLSFIGFTASIPITVASTAAINNGDEFMRNTDIAVDFSKFISEKFGISDLTANISSAGERVLSILGW